MAHADKREVEMEQHLQEFLDAGAGLEDLEAELERLGLLDEETVTTDADGTLHLWLEEETGSDRGWWNIRDVAAGDPTKARDLAEWVLRKRGKARKALAEAQAAYDRNLAQLKLWLERYQKEAARTDAFAEATLAEYMTDFHEGEKTLPMIAVPKLRWTKERDHIKWDEPGALAWAEEREDVDEVAPRSLKKSEAKARLEKRGQDYFDGDTGERVAFVWDEAPDQPMRFEIVDG